MIRKFSRFAVFWIVGGMAVAIAAVTSHAQWVSVGGGGVHVRAPFVRVDVGPYGGVHVRAPFTSIDTRARYYPYEPYGPQPVIIERRLAEPSLPTTADLAAMDDDTLRGTLASAANRLHARLGRFDTGVTWRRYLLRDTDEALADFSSGSGALGEAIAEMSERFLFVASQLEYHMIAGLPAFVAMQAILGEMEARLGQPDRATGAEELPLPPPQRARSATPFLTPDR